jgi:Ribbon-helix-helix protein, copG family
MKTTLNIDDTVMAELKREAARQGRTMSELVETALRLLLRSQRKRASVPALPNFRSGGALVDVADRAALHNVIEAHTPPIGVIPGRERSSRARNP